MACAALEASFSSGSPHHAHPARLRPSRTPLAQPHTWPSLRRRKAINRCALDARRRSTLPSLPRASAVLPAQWLLFPFLNLVFQAGDVQALFANRTVGATMYGASAAERATVVAGKLAHWSLVWVAPLLLHGPAAMFSGVAAYVFTQSIVLASTFAVSHNVPEAKPLDAGPTQVNGAACVHRQGGCGTARGPHLACVRPGGARPQPRSTTPVFRRLLAFV